MTSLRDSDSSTALLHVSQEEHLINGEEPIPLNTLRLSKQPFTVDQKPYQLVKERDTTEYEAAVDKDSKYSPSPPPLPRIKKRWITGLLLCALGVALALVAHVILTVKLAAKATSGGYGWGSSSAVIYEGTCHQANQIATGLHILVNIIVLTLTATSSYCNQVLAAPSRARIDTAHAQRVWVSIGSSSFTNVWYAPLWRKMLWVLIIGTSLPVQMIYNSFIYVSINANDFGIVAAPIAFGNNHTDMSGFDVPSNFHDVVGTSASSLYDDLISGKLEKLSNDTCMKAYSGAYQTARSTVVLLTPDLSSNLTAWSCQVALDSGGISTSSSYRGSQLSCAIDEYKGNYTIAPPISYIDEFQVHTCFSRPVTPTCELGCSLPIGLVVMGCIVLKLICMLVTALERRSEIFLTVGDALKSFLTCPDPYTANNCLMARVNKGQPKALHSFNDYPWVSIFSRAMPFRLGQSPPPQPKRVCTVRQRWSAALPSRLFAFLLFFKIALLAMAGLALGYNTSMFGSTQGADLNADGMSSWEQTLTSLYHTQFYPLGYLGFIATVLAVNVPQAVISIIYAVYNNTLTRMLLAAEYNNFGVERKPLRVSFPAGQQRSTYYLSVPYRYSVPFIVLSTLSHWLASEALSFVQIIPRDAQGNLQRTRSLHGVGASSVGLRVMVVPWLLMVVGFLILMFRKFKSAAMPIAMNCSAAISAACHPPPGDIDAAERPVMWGQVDMEIANLRTFLGPGVAEIETRCRRATFTSKEVVEPSPEFVYY
ncbi:hypothetical protein N7517_000473 [Penicillium concentricum]|uniref:DUF6536 domain-containing protein n=1 Tax=Penicillium concentricum TaxID=293559 RepID=A0A9W9SQC9_9EURO|nr:uncharacterized protein N7517_000473 [Penicillium concentricum]KAJ5382562.1 hypothetical protein N7517_000473 [Penicillium concentricum]